MNMQKKFKLACTAWVVNAVLFMLAWFGGDILMHSGFDYMSNSIEAMRITLGLTKTALTWSVLYTLMELKGA